MQNEIMVGIEKLNVHFGNVQALHIREPINIVKGDKLAIIGSNGAGKTTLINALLDIVPYEGKIEKAVPNEKIGVHLQFNKYNTFLKIKDIIETILDAKISELPKTQELITFFQFEESLNKRFEQLSGGQKQRLTLILVLSQDTELVFFDEVTTGLDFETRQDLINLINRWYEDKKVTLCYVTHYYEEIDNLATKVLLLEKGEVIAHGSKEDLFKKYCGKGIIVLKNTPENMEITKNFRHLVAPPQDIALSFHNTAEEKEILAVLSEDNIDYKRSSNDVEIMSANAKAAWLKERQQ